MTSPERMASSIIIRYPKPGEVLAERLKWGVSQEEFGEMLGRYRVGEERGRPLEGVPYRRQTVFDAERGRKLCKPFAVAFRRLQGALPEGVRIVSGVFMLADIPAGTWVVCGRLMRCAICKRWMLAWPTAKYCPECRKIARKWRRENGNGVPEKPEERETAQSEMS